MTWRWIYCSVICDQLRDWLAFKSFVLIVNFKESSEVKWEFILVSLFFNIYYTLLDNLLFLFIYFILVFVGIILLLSIVAAQKKNSKTGSKGKKKQESRSLKESDV